MWAHSTHTRACAQDIFLEKSPHCSILLHTSSALSILAFQSAIEYVAHINSVFILSIKVAKLRSGTWQLCNISMLVSVIEWKNSAPCLLAKGLKHCPRQRAVSPDIAEIAGGEKSNR